MARSVSLKTLGPSILWLPAIAVEDLFREKRQGAPIAPRGGAGGVGIIYILWTSITRQFVVLQIKIHKVTGTKTKQGYKV